MLLLLCASTCFAQTHRADRHPNTDPDEEGLYHQTFAGRVKVPHGGLLKIAFPAPFRFAPTCEFDGATLPGKQAKFSRDNQSVSIQAKAGKTMHYSCVGVKR